MGGRKFVKIAQVMLVLILTTLSGIWAPTMMALARPMNGKATVAGGAGLAMELDHAPVPRIGRSCATDLPISACPPPSSRHR